MKPKLTESKGNINNLKIVIGDFNIPLSKIEKKLTRQKIIEEIKFLNDTISQLDLTNIYKTTHPTITGYIFSSTPGRLSRLGHILGYNTGLDRLKRNGIT